MTDFPFLEKKLSRNIFLREFKQNQEDRTIKVVKSEGWQIQLDNKLPVKLNEGETYKIPAYLFHRVIKGEGDLIVVIHKHEKII